MAGLDAKVKSIIKDTVKSHSIKRDAIEFDQSLLDCELTGAASTRFPQSASAFASSSSTPSGPNTKKARKPDYIDLRSPTNTNSSSYRQDNSGSNSHCQGCKKISLTS